MERGESGVRVKGERLINPEKGLSSWGQPTEIQKRGPELLLNLSFGRSGWNRGEDDRERLAAERDLRRKYGWKSSRYCVGKVNHDLKRWEGSSTTRSVGEGEAFEAGERKRRLCRQRPRGVSRPSLKAVEWFVIKCVCVDPGSRGGDRSDGKEGVRKK